MAVFQVLQKGVTDALNLKLKKGKSAAAFLNRVIYPMYQNAQRARWASQNSSETGQWASLDAKYAEYKLKRYGGGPRYKNGPPGRWVRAGSWPNYPESGTKMMVATGRLLNSVTGDTTDDHRKIVTDTSIEIYTEVEYAEEADSKRNFTKFSDATIASMREAYVAYMAGDEP